MKVGKFEEVVGPELFPADFYDSIDDEAPLYAETPHDAPRWEGYIVAIFEDDEPTSIILLGHSESDALSNLVNAINDAFNEGEFGLDEILEAGYPDFDEHGALVGADFLLHTDKKGRHYTLHITFDEDSYHFEFRHVPRSGSITDHLYRTDNVPEDVYWKAIETLAELYFGV